MERSAMRLSEHALAPLAMDKRVENVESLHQQQIFTGAGGLQDAVNASNKVADELEAVRFLITHDHPDATALLEELQQNSRLYPNEPYLSWEEDEDFISWRCATGGTRWLMGRCSWCTEMAYDSEIWHHGCETHRICHECLRRSFRLAARDESMGLPGCCNHVFELGEPYLASILGPAIVDKYLRALVVYNSDNRTYCATKGCGKFIPPRFITDGNFAQCIDCHRYTCTWCKEVEHRGKACVLDNDEQALTDLAKERGWQKCFRCSRWIEREAGCDHMSCECLADWCYLCGQVWKTCNCDDHPPTEDQLRFDDDQSEPEDNQEQDANAVDNVERDILGLQEEGEEFARELALIGESEGYRSWGQGRLGQDAGEDGGVRGYGDATGYESASEDDGTGPLGVLLSQVTLTTAIQRTCIHSGGFGMARAHPNGRCLSCEEVNIGAVRCNDCDIIVCRLCAENPNLIVNFLGGE